MRHPALGRPISEHQADGHQCHGSRQIPAHAEREELLHPRLRGAVRAAAGRRGGHAAAAGRRAEGGGGQHEIEIGIGSNCPELRPRQFHH